MRDTVKFDPSIPDRQVTGESSTTSAHTCSSASHTEYLDVQSFSSASSYMALPSLKHGKRHIPLSALEPPGPSSRGTGCSHSQCRCEEESIMQNLCNKRNERLNKPCKNGFCYCFTSDSEDFRKVAASTSAGPGQHQCKGVRKEYTYNLPTDTDCSEVVSSDQYFADKEKEKKKKKRVSLPPDVPDSVEVPENGTAACCSHKDGTCGKEKCRGKHFQATNKFKEFHCSDSDAPLIHIIQEVKQNVVMSEIRINRSKLKKSKGRSKSAGRAEEGNRPKVETSNKIINTDALTGDNLRKLGEKAAYRPEGKDAGTNTHFGTNNYLNKKQHLTANNNPTPSEDDDSRSDLSSAKPRSHKPKGGRLLLKRIGPDVPFRPTMGPPRKPPRNFSSSSDCSSLASEKIKPSKHAKKKTKPADNSITSIGDQPTMPANYTLPHDTDDSMNGGKDNFKKVSNNSLNSIVSTKPEVTKDTFDKLSAKVDSYVDRISLGSSEGGYSRPVADHLNVPNESFDSGPSSRQEFAPSCPPYSEVVSPNNTADINDLLSLLPNVPTGPVIINEPLNKLNSGHSTHPNVEYAEINVVSPGDLPDPEQVGWAPPLIYNMLNTDTATQKFESQHPLAEPQQVGWQPPPKLQIDTVDGTPRASENEDSHNLAANMELKSTPVKPDIPKDELTPKNLIREKVKNLPQPPSKPVRQNTTPKMPTVLEMSHSGDDKTVLSFQDIVSNSLKEQAHSLIEGEASSAAGPAKSSTAKLEDNKTVTAALPGSSKPTEVVKDSVSDSKSVETTNKDTKSFKSDDSKDQTSVKDSISTTKESSSDPKGMKTPAKDATLPSSKDKTPKDQSTAPKTTSSGKSFQKRALKHTKSFLESLGFSKKKEGKDSKKEANKEPESIPPKNVETVATQTSDNVVLQGRRLNFDYASDDTMERRSITPIGGEEDVVASTKPAHHSDEGFDFNRTVQSPKPERSSQRKPFSPKNFLKTLQPGGEKEGQGESYKSYASDYSEDFSVAVQDLLGKAKAKLEGDSVTTAPETVTNTLTDESVTACVISAQADVHPEPIYAEIGEDLPPVKDKDKDDSTAKESSKNKDDMYAKVVKKGGNSSDEQQPLSPHRPAPRPPPKVRKSSFKKPTDSYGASGHEKGTEKSDKEVKNVEIDPSIGGASSRNVVSPQPSMQSHTSKDKKSTEKPEKQIHGGDNVPSIGGASNRNIVSPQPSMQSQTSQDKKSKDRPKQSPPPVPSEPSRGIVQETVKLPTPPHESPASSHRSNSSPSSSRGAFSPHLDDFFVHGPLQEVDTGPFATPRSPQNSSDSSAANGRGNIKIPGDSKNAEQTQHGDPHRRRKRNTVDDYYDPQTPIEATPQPETNRRSVHYADPDPGINRRSVHYADPASDSFSENDRPSAPALPKKSGRVHYADPDPEVNRRSVHYADPASDSFSENDRPSAPALPHKSARVHYADPDPGVNRRSVHYADPASDSFSETDRPSAPALPPKSARFKQPTSRPVQGDGRATSTTQNSSQDDVCLSTEPNISRAQHYSPLPHLRTTPRSSPQGQSSPDQDNVQELYASAQPGEMSGAGTQSFYSIQSDRYGTPVGWHQSQPILAQPSQGTREIGQNIQIAQEGWHRTQPIDPRQNNNLENENNQRQQQSGDYDEDGAVGWHKSQPIPSSSNQQREQPQGSHQPPQAERLRTSASGPVIEQERDVLYPRIRRQQSTVLSDDEIQNIRHDPVHDVDRIDEPIYANIGHNRRDDFRRNERDRANNGSYIERQGGPEINLQRGNIYPDMHRIERTVFSDGERDVRYGQKTPSTYRGYHDPSEGYDRNYAGGRNERVVFSDGERNPRYADQIPYSADYLNQQRGLTNPGNVAANQRQDPMYPALRQSQGGLFSDEEYGVRYLYSDSSDEPTRQQANETVIQRTNFEEPYPGSTDRTVFADGEQGSRNTKHPVQSGDHSRQHSFVEPPFHPRVAHPQEPIYENTRNIERAIFSDGERNPRISDRTYYGGGQAIHHQDPRIPIAARGYQSVYPNMQHFEAATFPEDVPGSTQYGARGTVQHEQSPPPLPRRRRRSADDTPTNFLRQQPSVRASERNAKFVDNAPNLPPVGHSQRLAHSKPHEDVDHTTDYSQPQPKSHPKIQQKGMSREVDNFLETSTPHPTLPPKTHPKPQKTHKQANPSANPTDQSTVRSKPHSQQPNTQPHPPVSQIVQSTVPPRPHFSQQSNTQKTHTEIQPTANSAVPPSLPQKPQPPPHLQLPPKPKSQPHLPPKPPKPQSGQQNIPKTPLSKQQRDDDFDYNLLPSPPQTSIVASPPHNISIGNPPVIEYSLPSKNVEHHDRMHPIPSTSNAHAAEQNIPEYSTEPDRPLTSSTPQPPTIVEPIPSTSYNNSNEKYTPPRARALSKTDLSQASDIFLENLNQKNVNVTRYSDRSDPSDRSEDGKRSNLDSPVAISQFYYYDSSTGNGESSNSSFVRDPNDSRRGTSDDAEYDDPCCGENCPHLKPGGYDTVDFDNQSPDAISFKSCRSEEDQDQEGEEADANNPYVEEEEEEEQLINRSEEEKDENMNSSTSRDLNHIGREKPPINPYESFKHKLRSSFRKSKSLFKKKRFETPTERSTKSDNDTRNRRKDLSSAEDRKGESDFEVDYISAIELLEESTKDGSLKRQLEQTVSLCRKIPEFEASLDMVEAERLLLYSTLKEKSTCKSNDSISSYRSTPKDFIYGRVCVTSLEIPTKPNIHHDTFFNYYYIGVFTHGQDIRSTQSAEKVDDAVFFADCDMLFEDLISDFEISVDLYVLRLRKLSSPPVQQDNVPVKIRKSSLTDSQEEVVSRFRMHGNFIIRASDLGPFEVKTQGESFPRRSEFYLTANNIFALPINLFPRNINLSNEVWVTASAAYRFKNFELSGFLNVGEELNGKLDWNRLWCQIDALYLHFWNYPQDCSEVPPILTLNLASCTSNPVQSANREICPKPKSFQLDIKQTIDSSNEESDDEATNIFFFSPESQEEYNYWVKGLNYVLDFIRAWKVQVQ